MKLSISDDEINFWIMKLYEIWSSEKEDKEVRILCKGTHAMIRFLQCGWYKYKNGLKNLEEYMKKSEMDIQVFHIIIIVRKTAANLNTQCLDLRI